MAVRRILILAAWCAAASAHASHASPRSDPTAGRAVFTGSTLPDATAISLDPAALGLGQLDQIYVAVTGLVEQVHVHLTPQGGPGSDVRDNQLAPGATIAGIYHLAGDQVTLGFAIDTEPDAAYPAAHPELQYFTLGGNERDAKATVGASLRVTGDLFVGASVSHQITFLRLSYARDTALAAGSDPALGTSSLCGTAACGVGNPAATERWDLNVQSPWLSTSNLRVNVGAVMQIAHDVWLGVAYHTPPESGVETELAGHVNVGVAPRDLQIGEQPTLRYQSVVEIQLPASVDAELRWRLPRQLDLHIGGRWEDSSRLSAYDVRAYGSTAMANNIAEWTERPLGLHDTFAGWAGIEQVDSGQRWLFGARIGYESQGIHTGQTSAMEIAPASATLDLGAQLRISSAVSLQLSYGLQYFPTVHVTDSAYDPTDVATCAANAFDYMNASCARVRNGYAIADGTGDYGRIEHAVRFGLRYAIQ